MVVGSIAGSFINVLVYRLPSVEAAHIRPNATKSLTYLAWPLSFCPHCGVGIKPWHNIPIVSYLLLHAKSPCCGRPISVRYLVLESLGALAAIACLARFGLSLQFVWACLFCWLLLAICWIDAKSYVLPDILVLPLLWLGLLANANGTFIPLREAVLSVVVGYVALYSLSEASRALIGRRMLGSGDPKLLAALGAWMGWLLFPALFIAAVTATLFGLGAQMVSRSGGSLRLESAVAFGPHLGIGGFFMMLVGGVLLNIFLLR